MENLQYVCSPEKGGTIWQELETKLYFWDVMPDEKSLDFNTIVELTRNTNEGK